MLRMLRDKGSVERRLFALVLVTVLGLGLVGGAGYAGAVMMRSQSVRAAHLQQALGLQQDADMVHDMLHSDALASVGASLGRRRDLLAATQRHRSRAVRDMRVSNSLLASSEVGGELTRRARADAFALRRYADQAVRVVAAPAGRDRARGRLWEAFDRQRVSMAELTDAIEAELASAHHTAVNSSRRMTTVTATVALAVLVALLALAVGIMRGIRRILRAQARAENAQAQQNIALREQADALIEADQIKGRLLAVTSHEIRGGLSATIVAVRTAQRLTGRGTADQLHGPLRQAERHAEQVLSVVVDVLSGQRRTGTDMRERWSNVFEIAQLAVDAAEHHKNGHRLRLEVAPIVCDVDALRLQQVLRNLVENAYKYTPSGSQVLVRATPEPEHLVITVADDGPGLPAQRTETLLQAYQRGPHAPGTEGSGLGLFVVNELVHAMHGELDVVSRPSAGASFTLRVPCRQKPVHGLDRSPAQATEVSL